MARMLDRDRGLQSSTARLHSVRINVVYRTTQPMPHKHEAICRAPEHNTLDFSVTVLLAGGNQCGWLMV